MTVQAWIFLIIALIAIKGWERSHGQMKLWRDAYLVTEKERE